ncbi:hypothetical protein EX30DRAFT_123840 [Ascodesmis nigricans]|uniref:Uncharacterized protein n=1 Tax=Ascodesmis nigricans TaxID=341454 RepID=A0A4S2MRS7_9PEZI|nr:hypothetical protein EX30DRAFT_123840 [Ascodesmis nigricans]
MTKQSGWDYLRLRAWKPQTLGESILTRHGCSKTKFQAQGNRKYLHKMLKLFDRNPLVMELALPNIAKWEQPLEEIYIDLLQGSTSMKSSRAASLYATKSIQMLGDVFQSLDDVSKRLLLALAPFWQVVKKNIDIYLMCLVFHNVLSTEDEDIGNAICDLWNVRAEGGNQARLPKLRALLEESGLTQKYHHLVQRLLSLGLLSINPKAIETSPEARESFYGIHPLLTIFLRQVMDGEHPQISVSTLLDAAALKRGFLDYFNQRSIAWSFYPEEAHIVAAYELMNEETNFLSAMSIPLQYGSADKCFCTFPSQIFIRLAAISQVDRQMQSTTNLIAHFCESIVERFEELRQRRGNRRIGETPTIIALFAAEWLCVYHAEVSGPEAFKTVINMTTKLIKYADENSSSYHHRLQEMIQQSCMQRAWAASDCLVDGLRLRRPFSGLISSTTELPSLTSSGGNSSPKFMETWCKFASQYLRLHSLAVQAQLTAAFRPELRHQLRDDFKVLWKAGYKILTETSLTPLISLYSWVDTVLASTNPREAATTPKISSTRFTGYLEFIRSQVFLLFRDPDSAKRQLLTGLELARENSDRDGEKLCHLRLCDLAFRSRSFDECIAHSEFIHDLQVDFPDNIEVNNNHQHHLSFAHLVLREALCHRQINQWDSAAASFATARTIAKFADERNIEYFAITKLAAIRQDHDIGFSTVTELLLDAITLAYSDPVTHLDHRGVLLRKMMNAAQAGKAGESMKDVIVRVAGRIGGVLEEVRRFLDDVIARERDIVLVRSKEGGSGADKIEGDIGELWKDAEVWLFCGGKGRRGESVRWRGTEWECGLRRV